MAVYCHKCGAGWISGEKFCRKCGTKLQSGDLPGNSVGQVEELSAEAGAHLSPGGPTEDIRTGADTRVLEPANTKPDITAPSAPAERSRYQAKEPGEATLPLYKPKEQEVESIPPAQARGPHRVVRVINVVVGFAIVGIAAALLVSYVGSGRPTGPPLTQQPEQQQQPPDNAPVPPPPEPRGDSTPEASKQALQPVEKTPEERPKNKEVRRQGQDLPSTKAETTVADQPPKSAPAGTSTPPAPKPTGSDNSSVTTGDHLKRGLELFNGNSYGAAIKEFQTVARAQPGNQDVHYLMGVAYEKLGRAGDALSEYQMCKSGTYASLAAQHVKRLSKQLKKE